MNSFASNLVVVFIWFLQFCMLQCHLLETPLGRVKGLDDPKKNYLSFMSIPYAQAPTGPSRFQPPQPLEEWIDIVDGTVLPVSCPQLQDTGKVIGNEDCLFMNIYVPRAAFKENKLLPVLFHIHGGGFTTGSSHPHFYGPDYFMDTEKVVLVSINYRLGALGWLTTEDDVISGNMGLRDQIMALQWVNKYIHSFHGNPEEVTVMGQSAGGMSVSELLISPATEGLFQKAISMSGPVYNAVSLHVSESRTMYASTLAEHLNCDEFTESQEILECLQKQSMFEIVANSNMFEKFLWTPNPWKPVVDNFCSSPVLPISPNDAFNNGTFRKMPTMLGGVRDEGAVYLPQLIMQPDLIDTINDDFDVLGPVLILHIDEQAVTEEDSSTVNLLRLHYLDDGGNSTFSKKNWRGISKMIGHTRYTGPVHQQVLAMMDKTDKPLYYYQLTYRGTNSFVDFFGYEPDTIKDMPDLGVSHGDDLLILFSQNGVKKSKRDLDVSKKVVRYFVNFALTGNPSTTEDKGEEWKPIQGSSEPEYAVLDDQPLRMELSNEFKSDMEFVTSMHELISGYRKFDLQSHPALLKLMEDKEKELHDEL